jgi:hypothetical protein
VYNGFDSRSSYVQMAEDERTAEAKAAAKMAAEAAEKATQSVETDEGGVAEAAEVAVDKAEAAPAEAAPAEAAPAEAAPAEEAVEASAVEAKTEPMEEEEAEKTEDVAEQAGETKEAVEKESAPAAAPAPMKTEAERVAEAKAKAKAELEDPEAFLEKQVRGALASGSYTVRCTLRCKASWCLFTWPVMCVWRGEAALIWMLM